MAKSVRISLANKCQLLFGAAVVFILIAALAVVWGRLQVLVEEGQEETARKLANAWLAGHVELGLTLQSVEELTSDSEFRGDSLAILARDEFEVASSRDPFIAAAIDRFETRTRYSEYFRPAMDPKGRRYYRYARAVRKSDMERIRSGPTGDFSPAVVAPLVADPVRMVMVVQLRSELAERQLMLNRIYIVGAGLIAGLLAIGLFWFITTRLILSPVRVLRDTAAKVSQGDLNIRSEINTGDEYEQLSDMFNNMLEVIKQNQDQLRGTNKTLDLKLGELAEHNIALYEANKIKGEFLANVSHELRTPLNSIIGFGEVLEETLKDRTGPVDEKRKRYVANIITSSRRLLDLINELLDLSKIEAGRMDIHARPMSVADTVEGLVNLIRPQADKKQITLTTYIQPNIPLVQTDAGKFQQILFNFLSNAVKFTPHGGEVTVSADLLPPAAPGKPTRLRTSVKDTGPGIPLDKHEKVFEKFTQLDSTVTKEHGGTGLGLTISRELAHLLQGQITLDSDTGQGATFTLIIPTMLESTSVPLMPELGVSRAQA